jgi:hypothetical protein
MNMKTNVLNTKTSGAKPLSLVEQAKVLQSAADKAKIAAAELQSAVDRDKKAEEKDKRTVAVLQSAADRAKIAAAERQSAVDKDKARRSNP